jgi:hypothetical protein
MSATECDLAAQHSSQRRRTESSSTGNIDASGAITKLDQHLKLDKGASKTEIMTHYDSKTNQPDIQVVLPTGPQKLTEPGLVIVPAATVNGNLSLSDGTRIWP